MIEELESMSHRCLSMYMRYGDPSLQRFQLQQRTAFSRYREMAEKKAAGTSAPNRIIFYCSQFSCIDFVLPAAYLALRECFRGPVQAGPGARLALNVAVLSWC
jgi:hypothetical protein